MWHVPQSEEALPQVVVVSMLLHIDGRPTPKKQTRCYGVSFIFRVGFTEYYEAHPHTMTNVYAGLLLGVLAVVHLIIRQL